ncbi:MAG: tRNA pseudouridine(13) synthase TruD [Candidatus Thorarchaeota archaeon]|nr:tRNA pseudouridine(13) synthase TruD [Candidatus Thorarchaeota archaeon]
MVDAHPLEKALGMELYSTDFPGIGGRLKIRFEDFVVEEISADRKALVVHDWSESTETPQTAKGESNRFATFTVQKMGLSTMDVANIIAATLKISRTHVTYAGLKDKRAITAQSMSVPSKSVESLLKLELSRIAIRDANYTRHPVHIGDLWGNRFTILIKNITSDCDSALEVAGQLRERTLLNYFGVQRFGVTRPNTHLVGKALIKRDFEDAVRVMLCTTSEYESEELTNIRLQISENLTPTEQMIESFPEDMGYEKAVMRELIKHPGDFERAITKIPPRVMTLQVHSFQSYIFNRLLTERVRLGLSVDNPEVGDFLIKLDETHSGRDTWLYVTESSLEERQRQVETEEYGIALPIPGYSTRLPSVKQSDLVKQIMKDEDVRLADFRNPKMRPLDSPGGFHLASIKIPDLDVSCCDEGLQARFSLRKGSYATIVMREIMKNHPINRV